jgi:hypothetical protein
MQPRVATDLGRCTLRGMTVIRSLVLFAIAALAEIGGGGRLEHDRVAVLHQSAHAFLRRAGSRGRALLRWRAAGCPGFHLGTSRLGLSCAVLGWIGVSVVAYSGACAGPQPLNRKLASTARIPP